MVSMGKFRFGEGYMMCLVCSMGIHRHQFPDNDIGDMEFQIAWETFLSKHRETCTDDKG